MAEDSEPYLIPTWDDDGQLTGWMDQMTADFLASTAPDPMQASLDSALDGVTRVRLLGLRLDERYAVFDVPVLDVTDVDDLAEFVAALRIAEADQYGHCMCIGDYQLELWAGDRLVHTFGLHHWTSIRWSEWAGDADLADPWRFADWLLRFGITEARDHLAEMEESRRLADEHDAVWERAMPPSLRPLWPDRLDDPDGDLGAARAVLEGAVPDPVERVRALYAWFGSLATGWNSFYQYEEVPEALLHEYSIEVLLEAADTDNDAEMLGAARLFGVGRGFEYIRAADRTRCPEPLRQRMLDVVQRQGIAENVVLLRAAFDRPGS